MGWDEAAAANLCQLSVDRLEAQRDAVEQRNELAVQRGRRRDMHAVTVGEPLSEVRGTGDTGRSGVEGSGGVGECGGGDRGERLCRSGEEEQAA